MTQLKLFLIFLAFSLGLCGCGPVNMAIWNGTTWVTALTVKNMNEDMQNMFDGLGCSMGTWWPATLWIDANEAQVDELLAMIHLSHVTSGADFWTKLPFEISNIWNSKIEEAYLNLDSDSQLLKQNVKFYKSLFAYGIVRARTEGIRSGRQSFVKTFMSGNKKNRTITSFAIGIFQMPSRYKKADGHEADTQYTNFCP